MSTAPLLPPAATRTVGDVAAESGVADSAVRFYERHGVVTAVRTPGNQRRFDESAACRIKVAKLAQRVGLTVREISDVFAGLPASPQPQDWGRVADILITEAEARAAELRTRLADIRDGTRLCEVIDSISDHSPAHAAAGPAMRQTARAAASSSEVSAGMPPGRTRRASGAR